MLNVLYLEDGNVYRPVMNNKRQLFFFSKKLFYFSLCDLTLTDIIQVVQGPNY